MDDMRLERTDEADDYAIPNWLLNRVAEMESQGEFLDYVWDALNDIDLIGNIFAQAYNNKKEVYKEASPSVRIKKSSEAGWNAVVDVFHMAGMDAWLSDTLENIKQRYYEEEMDS